MSVARRHLARSLARATAALAWLTLGPAACMAGGLPGSPDASGAPVATGPSNGSSGAGDAATGGQANVTLQTGAGAPDAGAPTKHADGAASATADGATTPSGEAGGAAGSGYQIDISETSVSGFSSGAFMAVQFHVAFSSILKGAAIFAGGPYDCAQGSANTAETTCLTGSPDVSALVAVTKQNYAAGTIDDPGNLANERVFIFGGADDSVVHPSVVDALDSYYGSFMSSSSIQYASRHAGASHTMPTLSYGGDCDSVVSPYVGKCDYDGAGTALQQIYGTLAAPATTLSGTMLSFAQARFVANPSVEGLADTGYYYVPASCAQGEPCRVHVSFHGCEQNAALVNDAYYGHAGYNEWADTNHIIVLYPQATSSSGNDYECWDFWGYDGASYATKAGTQVAAVRAMIGWLAAGGATDGGTTSTGTGSTADAGSPGSFALPDGGIPLTSGASCITATNPAQVAAGRAHALSGYAYATGSDELLGANNASTSSSLEESSSGYYTICL